MPLNENGKYKIETEKRISIIETCLEILTVDIKDIKLNVSNHVKSLTQDIKELQKKIDRRPDWFITGLLSLMGLLIGFIINSFL